MCLCLNLVSSTSFEIIASDLVWDNQCYRIWFYRQIFDIVRSSKDISGQRLKYLFSTSTWVIFWTTYNIKNLSVKSNSTALIIPQTKFEPIISEDVAGDRFQAKTHVSWHILDLSHYNFLPVAPIYVKHLCICWKASAESFPKMYTFTPFWPKVFE